MTTLYDAMNPEEKFEFDNWRAKMHGSKTRIGVLYCEWRATLVARAAKQRLLSERAKSQFMHYG